MGRLFAKWAVFFGLVAASIVASPSEAHTPTLSGNGVPVRWVGRPRIPLAGNPSNRSGIDPGAFFSAVVRGLQRWSAASYGTTAFDYWQGTDPSIYEPNSDFNGLSSIYFASSSSGAGLGANVLGLTQVWYDVASGRILETDIVLNDLSYRFTTNPRDTSGYGSGGGNGRNVFIENVITHELGHAYGLSHSGGLQTTMLFMESPEQAYLGCDEQSGIRSLYRGSASDGAGSIVGAVVSERTGQPVFGAQVQAISRSRGAVMSSGITDRMGRYSLGQLPADDYYLLVEPFFAGPSALPGYYAEISSSICGGSQSFSRTFLSESADPNALRPVGVPGGALVTAPDLVARCSSSPLAASVSAMNGAGASFSAPVVARGGDAGFGIIDRFESGASGTRYFKLNGVSGDLRLNAIGYSLYSPVRLSLSLRDPNGSQVASQFVAPVYSSATSGYVNYDAALMAKGLPPGDYLVEVRAAALGASDYPAGQVSRDSVPFFVLSGVPGSDAAGSGQISAQARCQMSESFPAYSSPPGPPERRNPEEDEDGVGFCGNIRIARGGDSGGGPDHGPGAAAIIGWFLPWTAALAMLRGRRLAATFKG